MNAIVTVFKNELVDKGDLRDMLSSLSFEIKELGDAYIYSPSGKLIPFLTILRDHKIAYGTHFNTSLD